MKELNKIANPFSKGYKHRHGEPVSDACGDGKHSECDQDLTKCHCTVRFGHKTHHAYMNPRIPASAPAPLDVEKVAREWPAAQELWNQIDVEDDDGEVVVIDEALKLLRGHLAAPVPPVEVVKKQVCLWCGEQVAMNVMETTKGDSEGIRYDQQCPNCRAVIGCTKSHKRVISKGKSSMRVKHLPSPEGKE